MESKKPLANIITALIILVFMGFAFTIILSIQKEENQVVVCPADAMLCPDGSYVGRSGPNCEFSCSQLCKEGDGCCLASQAAVLQEGNYLLTEESEQCDEGYSVNMMKCESSLRWCTPDLVRPEPASTTAPIIVDTPLANAVITSPLQLQGQAPGNWYFEATAPVVIVNWDGLIIAEGLITAEGEWMTTDFVPFTGTLQFVSPYKVGDPEFMQRGAIIFKKDNPSGLPEHDDALEIPILFAKE